MRLGESSVELGAAIGHAVDDVFVRDSHDALLAGAEGVDLGVEDGGVGLIQGGDDKARIGLRRLDAGEDVLVLGAGEVGDAGAPFAGVGAGEVVGGGGLWLLADGAGGGVGAESFEADGGAGEGEVSFLGGDGDAVVASASEELVAGVDLALVGFEAE